jgi:nitroreductase
LFKDLEDEGDEKMDVLEAIRTKRAVRHFSGQAVPEEVIQSVVDAGRLAQSSKNTQPWQFIVVRDADRLRQLASCGTYAGHLAGAAFGVVLVSSVSWTFDIGQAAAYMQLAGWSQGVSSCIATLHDDACARAVLGVPPEQYLEIALSFGYGATAPTPPQSGGRQPLNKVVRWEQW